MNARTDDMPLHMTLQATRREVLKGGAALTVAIGLPLSAGAGTTPDAAAKGPVFEPGAFIRIGADDTVTVLSKHLEMGQGVYSGLATIVAEELDANWSKMNVEGAPADAKLYNNAAFGPIQGTGGSTSISNSYDQLRKAGATARAMLVSAAAQRWKVPAGEITVANGVVAHKASNHSARFGELVADAAKLPVPADVKLKDPSTFSRIGKDAARLDARAKSTGTATFTQDVKLPGMLTAAVVHPPRFGAKVKSFDATKARAIKGVKTVVAYQTPVRSGVAVLATDFWAAKKGAEALTVEWDESSAFKRSTADIFAEYRDLAQKPGEPARQDGDVEKAFAGAAKLVEATYEFPFLAHASMEPLNCVVRIGANECEVWNGEQFQTVDQMAIAKLLGLPPSSVKLNQLFAGGSFGRRASPQSDYLLDAAALTKAAGVSEPVKMVWTRENDMRGGFYRPMYLHTLKAGLDAQGKIVAWRHRIVGQSIMSSAGGTFGKQGSIDQTSVEGASNLPYDIPDLTVELRTTTLQIPIQWWRSVGSTHTAFATECFLDDIARETKQDPYALRRSMLSAKHTRHRAVLDLVAEKSGWKKPRGKDEVWGLALHESFNTVVAQVAQLKRNGAQLKLEKVVCALDCGIAVNPNIVQMQMESGIGYGLAAALTGAITVKDGKIEQGNFDDYPVLRIHQAPRNISISLVEPTPDVVKDCPDGEVRPTGVGEPPTPAVAPALANAIVAAGGPRLREIPFCRKVVVL